MTADRPALRRKGAAPNTGIVHFGPGAFFRAFNATFTEDAMAASGEDWGIAAVSLKSATARDQLGPQGCAYTSITLHEDGPVARVIGSVTQVLVAPDSPEAVANLLADPAIKIVSLTITEKGYCISPASGDLDLDHPEIRTDLRCGSWPTSAIGWIVAGLAARRAQGGRPFTVLSCDNLPGNGQVTQNVVLAFARAVDAGLAEWIAAHGAFPSTMVDRITPATTKTVVQELAEREGYVDPACVTHEPFRQWVIEDTFVDGLRPAWERAGAQFVADVSAHEHMKLRCLNGTHSSLAYLGYLAGHETIASCMADPPFAAFCDQLWAQEITPTLTRPEGEDLSAYTRALAERYRNPAIQHRTWQIAMDGSQKLPQRILGTIADALAMGLIPKGLMLSVAGWMRYVGGRDEVGQPIDVRDPMAAALLSTLEAGPQTSAARVDRVLALEAIFPSALVANPVFRQGVTDSYGLLLEKGAREGVLAYLDQAH